MVELQWVAYVGVFMLGEIRLRGGGHDCEVATGADGIVGSVSVVPMVKAMTASLVHDSPFRVLGLGSHNLGLFDVQHSNQFCS